MASKVPYGAGGWEMPIGFKALPAGGSCAPGCHKPKEYNYVKPVEYVQEPPEKGAAKKPKKEDGR